MSGEWFETGVLIVQPPSAADHLGRFPRTIGGVMRLGVGTGDRVIIYMPMVPEAVIAMLACARIGAVHSVVFGGFAAHELATRIDDAAPKVILSASCGIEPGRVVAYKPLLDEAIDLSAAKPDHCVILQREQETCDLIEDRDLEWTAWEAAAEPADCVSVAATDPLYIIYTSGTTGQPKGIVRDNGGHLVVLGWSMRNIYGVEPGEVFWAASDVGWVVGHSYIAYGPLMNGNTSILFEPSEGADGRNGMLVSSSRDGGLNWSDPVVMGLDQGKAYAGHFHDKNTITADPTDSSLR